jgi:hypothetical protein
MAVEEIRDARLWGLMDKLGEVSGVGIASDFNGTPVLLPLD